MNILKKGNLGIQKTLGASTNTMSEYNEKAADCKLRRNVSGKTKPDTLILDF